MNIFLSRVAWKAIRLAGAACWIGLGVAACRITFAADPLISVASAFAFFCTAAVSFGIFDGEV